MKSLTISVLFISLIATVVAEAAEFEIDFKSDGKRVATIHILIESDSAVATVAGETERFNLKEMTWLDAGSNQWITVEQCKAWLEQSKLRTTKNLESAPAHIRRFVEWSMTPAFTVERTGNVLRLTSGQVDYVIEGEAARSATEGYFRYAVLNAYKKAITERKLPPYSELKAIEEMKALGHIPRSMSVTIPAIPGSPAIVVEVREAQK